MIGSTYFGHCYAHHQELTAIVLITTLAVRFLGAIGCSTDNNPACLQLTSNQQQPKNEMANVVIGTIVVSS